MHSFSIQATANLLHQVAAINRRYEGLGKITGENFNIFKLLGVATHEVKTHSKFLAELLNPKGSHEQGPVFLKLFLSQFDIVDFDPSSASVKVEFHTGTVSEDTGGRIDILITDAHRRHIIIENKIYAGEQANQLLRYYNFGTFQSSLTKLFYLTLYGDKPTDWGTGGQLKEGDCTCISYQSHMIIWLENCKKEAVNLPILRETITQYIYLIKYLTNQTTNYQMQEDIVKLVLDNENSLKSFVSLSETTESVLQEILERFRKSLEPIAEKFGLDLKFAINRNEPYTGIWFTGDKLAKYNLSIGFEFENKGTRNLYFGFYYIDKKHKELTPKSIQDRFKEKFGVVSSTEDCATWAWWQEYRSWNLETYIKVYKGELTPLVEEKVRKMVEIIDEWDKEDNNNL